MALPDEVIPAMTVEEATEMTLVVRAPRTFEPALGMTTSIIRTGTFRILQGARLRHGIDTFLNLTNNFAEAIEITFQWARGWAARGSERARRSSSPDPSDLRHPGGPRGYSRACSSASRTRLSTWSSSRLK